MNLTELADVAEHVSHNELNKKTSDAMGHIAALLRAAACEQVGTEWPDSNPLAVTLEKMHNRELAAARLAVANAKAERDAALARELERANSSAPLTGSPMPNHSETPKSSPVPGSNPAVTLAFKQSLNEASEIVRDWPAWKRDILKPDATVAENATPAAATPAATPQEAGVSTRELVARLAEVIHLRWEEASNLSPTMTDWAGPLSAIISDARRGGAE